MAKEQVKGDEKEKQEYVKVPDMVGLWKEMYFAAEESWANTTKELITTQNFVNLLDRMRDQYLSYHKVTEQNLDKYFKVNPIPSKKDISRVAELVIGLEDKIDDLDSQFSENITSIASSLIKLVEFQTVAKEEMQMLRKEMQALDKRLNSLEKMVKSSVAPAKTSRAEKAAPAAKSSKSKKASEKPETRQPE